MPQSWILNCLKMYKIPGQVIKFIVKTVQTWRVEMTAGVKSLAEVKIQRDIFRGDALSPLPFVIAKMPLNRILRKYVDGYKPSKLQEKINHMGDIKVLPKMKKKPSLKLWEYTVKI